MRLLLFSISRHVYFRGSKHSLALAAAFIAATSISTLGHAQDATWLNPATQPGGHFPNTFDFNTDRNWSPAIAPTGTAFFGVSTTNALSFTADTTIGGWTFNPGASDYSFITNNRIIFNGSGIVINGGSATITIDHGGGEIDFNNSSSAGYASIANSGALYFSNGNPGNATITNNAGGTTYFEGNSTAQNATIINNNGGTTSFHGSNVNAGNAVITTNAGGAVYFYDHSDGSNAKLITNAGGVVDISGAIGPGFRAASIAGAGTYNLGGNELILNLPASTTVSGTINDGGASGGTGASLYVTYGNISPPPFETLTLSGLNTYTGGTTIDRLVLAVSKGSQAGTNYSSVGTGEVNLSNATFKNVSGGSLTFTNVFKLAPFFPYLGVDGGTFDTSGGNLTIIGSIKDSSSLGSLAVTGGGTLALAGTSTYTGATTVNGGTLSVTGDISSSSGVTVNSGGTLGGTGTAPATTINAGGTLMPGLQSSIGTLNVAGNLTFASPTAAYLVSINGTTASTTSVTGTATLGGAGVNVANGSTIVPGQKYTILTAAGGIGGTTFNPTANFGNYATGALSYDVNDVFLTLSINSMASLLPAGAPTNVSYVADTIDAFTKGGGNLPSWFQNLFNLPQPQLVNALSQISGEAGAHGGMQASAQMMNSFLSLLLNPFGGSPEGNFGSVGIGRGFAAAQEPSPEATQAYAAVTPKERLPSSALVYRWNVWGQAYGGTNRTVGETNAGTHDTTSRGYGLATGADYRVSPDLLLGFAIAGGGTNYSLSDGLGGGRSDFFQIGVYGSKQYGPAYLSAALSYAWHAMKTDRTVTVSGTDNLTASFNAQSFGGRLECGYRFATPWVGVTPYAALQLQNFRTPYYMETATSGTNAFALSYNPKSTISTRTELGAWFDKMIALDRGNLLVLRSRAAWANDHSSDESVSAAFQTLPGSIFTVNGAAAVPNSALLSAGAEYRIASGVSFGAKFDGEFASRAQTYAGTGTVRSVW